MVYPSTSDTVGICMSVTETSPLVDPELVEAFRRDGFVVVPDLLSDEETGAYGDAVTRAVHERNAGDDVPLEKKSRYQQSFIQCMNLWEDYEDVRPLTFHPRLDRFRRNVAIFHAASFGSGTLLPSSFNFGLTARPLVSVFRRLVSRSTIRCPATTGMIGTCSRAIWPLMSRRWSRPGGNIPS